MIHMLEVIERMDGYTTSKNNGVHNPDQGAVNAFFKEVLKNESFSPDSYINCLSYMTCYPGLPDHLRKEISQREKEVYISLSQGYYETEENHKVR